MLGVGRGEKGRKGATGWLAVPTASPKLPLSKKMQAARLSSVNGFLEVMKTQWGKKPPPCMPSPPPPPGQDCSNSYSSIFPSTEGRWGTENSLPLPPKQAGKAGTAQEREQV